MYVATLNPQRFIAEEAIQEQNDEKNPVCSISCHLFT